MQIRAAVQEYVGGREDLAWARAGPSSSTLGWRIRQAAHLVGVPPAAMVLLPRLVIALPTWVVLLRLHERRGVPTPVFAGTPVLYFLAPRHPRLCDMIRQGLYA
ncbi:hypothetical protein ACO0M4_08050 [Streptomyces sp. RGM 3693]|uniref:hypothetical protein n=1 Tax=Streptomyces sp. RGM 3693 TaxID=3413284 RepID=UPI003D2B2F7C